MLLMLLAVVAVPGSILPQRPQDPTAVARYLRENPGFGPWLDRLGFFDVYSSVWFSAVYLLLFISLIGCILPRVIAHVRGWRARPPRAPRRFERFDVHDALVTDATGDEVLAAAHGVLTHRRRFRVEPGDEPRRRPRVPHAPWPPSAATCARPATSSSTWRWWVCSSRSRPASCCTTAVRCWWSRATASRTPLPPTTRSRPAPPWTRRAWRPSRCGSTPSPRGSTRPAGRASSRPP